jgi:hypothetical protein
VECKHNENVDIYSFAMICYELITGIVPWEGITDRNVLKRVTQRERPALPPWVDASWRAVIEACWHQESEQRWSATRIVEFIKGIPATRADPYCQLLPRTFELLSQQSFDFVQDAVLRLKGTGSALEEQGWISCTPGITPFQFRHRFCPDLRSQMLSRLSVRRADLDAFLASILFSIDNEGRCDDGRVLRCEGELAVAYIRVISGPTSGFTSQGLVFVAVMAKQVHCHRGIVGTFLQILPYLHPSNQSVLGVLEQSEMETDFRMNRSAMRQTCSFVICVDLCRACMYAAHAAGHNAVLRTAPSYPDAGISNQPWVVSVRELVL